ncbi:MULTISPECIES: trypsin-like peptidase domain-containing protein [unclassified Coleofasciculus]|uniref:trypsin-like peptidase domain-containing protein n=1 Tax=unclassified Coleofasciculus TaxID=2692782 RepID=UPI0018830488|nr:MULTISPECIES: trypsin-like peptidase domain-containing protein [unclassified Coleofasciculus]MBE9125395.1 trypsin-like peptidase domain-containing protein [Coleofasciculus sp. LEGE 07081]MBE9147388.1 trypsin-like peptidase domain-containing protein [Coleofasciculus sp. LEGE 07092]
MSTKRLRIATSGIITAAAAIGAITFDAIATVDGFSFSLKPHAVLAQDIDEQINIRVYQRASPAVVSIDTGNSTGSGSIMTSDGIVLTNAHVVAGYPTVNVMLADGRRLAADVIAFGDSGLDLAVLKIRSQNNLPTVTLAQTSVQVGQRAFAIGNPFGQFQGTFTVGIVSRIDPQRGLIQTDAAINPGNSGGPLLNSQGELIGVNTAIFGSPNGGNIGIGFAIAIDKIQPFLAAVREGRAPRTAVQQAPTPSDRRPQPLALNGAVVPGRLGQGSNVLPVDNSFFDLYAFEGRAGQRIQIDMSSRQIDSYLILLDVNGNDLAQDDDSGGGTNAKIVTTLPTNGTYLLIANSYEAGQAGSYNLQAAAAGRSSVSRDRFILQQEGILDPGASVLPSDGSLFKVHAFEGRAGQSVTLDLISPDFDTYLVVLDSNGQPIGENDDISQNNSNSNLTVTLPRTGVYNAIVNAYDRRGRGRYRLTVR